MRVLRAFCRLVANHCPEPTLRHVLFKLSGIKIGSDSYLNMGVIVVDDYNWQDLVIKDRVAIAPNVTIITSSNPNKSNLSQYITPINKPVVIDNDSWVGSGVIIMPGVTVGEGSILGAGSVIIKNVEPFSVMVGNPARKIKDTRHYEK